MSDQVQLTGINVLLTRPQLQSASLVKAITGRGGRVCEVPLIEIESVSDSAACEAIKSRILALDQYDAAIFISTNAARIGLQWIDAWWPQVPAGLTAYAVGPGTARALQVLDWPVLCSDKGVTSEHLLALSGLQDIDGQRIALFRGVGGRELIAETLRSRGATVDYLELYHRRTPDYGSDMLLNMIRQEHINAIVVTSAQILDVLLHFLKNDPSAITSTPVVVPSERIRQYALDTGLVRVINAGGADDATVLEALASIASPLR
ncbi:uroporphyrinogen-III synthase [Pseudohongiella sp.]|uniref:uroporphyrinogen-III synthase n=1 Tax=marine sediment metagenome TaxID=412755 RepID=A0A0F9Z4I6_9ZZZZ|nr:uroporphyrinogen-III synthase [Pseudohongiella sp.]HDZ07767.1 uroporphyrinogen-III synthase [Pseudohongiella sp.]HEA62916.1 uroporphyrinogen-III synthase [Pseudohongiella sp.]